MSKNVNIELSDDDFEKLRSKKKRLGLTWEGLLKYNLDIDYEGE